MSPQRQQGKLGLNSLAGAAGRRFFELGAALPDQLDCRLRFSFA
jgi:hypothetical protein